MTIDTYNAAGDLVGEADSYNPQTGTMNETSYSFNALDRPAQVQVKPAQDTPLLGPTYDKMGNMLSSTDAEGNVTNYVYDARNRLVEKVLPSPDGTAPRPAHYYTYNAAGELLTETDPLENVTTCTYDHLGRMITETAPDPNGGPSSTLTTTYAYDLVGNLLSTTDALGHVTSQTYDPQNNILSSSDGDGHTTTYTYDLDGRRLTLTDPDANTTTWTYDGLGRVTSQSTTVALDVNAQGTIDTATATDYYQYDLDNNLTQYTDADGRVTVYTYDHLNEKTGEAWYADAQDAASRQNPLDAMTFGYDNLGEMTSASDATGTFGFQYDLAGRVLASTVALTGVASTVTFNQTYDYNGDRTGLSAVIGTTPDFSNTYSYDNLGELTQIEQTGTGGNTVADKQVDLTYDPNGRLAAVDCYQGAAYAPVAQSAYTYDDASRLTGLTYTAGTTSLAAYSWTYNDANLVTSETSVDGTTSFTYDNANQLLSAGSASETYDPAGNRSASGDIVGDGNRLMFDGTYYYTYDKDGNRTSQYQLDNQGNHVNVTTYAWDNRNRLTSVTTPAGTVTYAYDAFNNLAARTVNGATEYYYYDGQNLALVLDSSANVIERELDGPAVNQVFATEWPDSSGTDPTQGVRWLLTDGAPACGSGTVRDVAAYDAVHGQTSVVDHLVYGAFGDIVSQTQPSAEPRFTYAGERFDAATGLYEDGARWYDPKMGSFLGEDPTGFAGGDANLTRYVQNDPVNATDPLGLYPRYNPGYGEGSADMLGRGGNSASVSGGGGYYNSGHGEGHGYIAMPGLGLGANLQAGGNLNPGIGNGNGFICPCCAQGFGVRRPPLSESGGVMAPAVLPGGRGGPRDLLDNTSDFFAGFAERRDVRWNVGPEGRVGHQRSS